MRRAAGAILALMIAALAPAAHAAAQTRDPLESARAQQHCSDREQARQDKARPAEADLGPYGLGLLLRQVRAAAIEARAAERLAQASAKRARANKGSTWPCRRGGDFRRNVYAGRWGDPAHAVRRGDAFPLG